MKETLEMMRAVVADYENTKTLDELLLEYKQNQSYYVIARLFVDNYGLFTKMARTYTLLDEQDIVSFGLQELDKAILDYDFNCGTKFITLFMTYFNNRLLAEQHCLLYNKRRANYFTENLDVLCDTPGKEYSYFDLDDYNLTNQEKKHVSLLMSRIFCKRISSYFFCNSSSNL